LAAEETLLTEKKLRIGIIGAGRIGKVHAET
jgi:lactate dehydrogenase-like 2-hydroxyacid dehydrogenase